MPHHIVGCHGLIVAIVIGDGLAGGQFEVVADGRMRIRVILRCYSTFGRELFKYCMELLPITLE
jgi:hypothetical protein